MRQALFFQTALKQRKVFTRRVLLFGVFLLMGKEAHCLAESMLDARLIYRQNARKLDLQAQSLIRDRRYPEAVELYREAIRRNPNAAYTATLYNNLAKAYEASGELRLAILCYQYATRLQPDFAPYYENLVNAWKQGGQLLTAEAQLQAIVVRNASDAQAWFLLGLISRELGKIAEQQQAWREFLALEPHSKLRPMVCFGLSDCGPAYQEVNRIPYWSSR